MNDWASGYVTGIGYTHGYYRDLSPAMISLAALNQGVRGGGERAPRYLELGFGQGLSLNIHAAACPGEYWGNDFLPGHAANARELAQASGSGATILDDSFEELAARDDLPEFDVIVLHGIWSWVNEANRTIIVDLIRRKLAVGGRVFVSYNCAAGWAQVMPLRHLLSLHTQSASAPSQPVAGKIDAAVEFGHQVMAAGALFLGANPAAATRLEKLRDEDRGYLAHEYFNRDWLPTYFSDVAERLATAKLTFAASGFLQDSVDLINLTAAGQQLLNGIPDPVLRETTRDILVNRRFRKDIFIKGPLAMAAAEQREVLGERRFVLTCEPEQVPRGHPGALGRLDLPPQVFEPLVAILAEDGRRQKSFAEILGHPAWKGQAELMLRQSLMLLVASTAVDPAQPDEVIEAARPACHALNRHLFAKARHGVEAAFVASPVTGGGVALDRYSQLFLAAYQDGHKSAKALAAAVWPVLEAQGVAFTRDGSPLGSAEANIAELTAPARAFLGQLPRLKALGLAD